jgi:NAD+ synthase (glutamine-hydrolysing)
MKKVVIGQMNSVVGDIWGNVGRIDELVSSAREQGAGIVVFPQFSLCGVPVHDLVFHKDFSVQIEKAILQLASKTKGLTVIVGTILKNGENLHDGAVIFHDGSEVGRQHVMAQLWDVDGCSFGLLVGESFAQTFSSTPDIVFHLVASAWNIGIIPQRLKLARNIVSHSGSPYLFVNLVGGNDGWIFDGRSFLFSEEGKLQFLAPACQEGAFLVKEGCFAKEKPDVEGLYEVLKLGIRDFFWKSQKKDAIVAISGGIDSAVVAALAVDALGAEHVHALALPSPITSSQSSIDAVQLAKSLNMSLKVLPIDSVLASSVGALSSSGCSLDQVSLDNLQARIRSLLIMAMSNVSDALWLATGNKSELMVGYSTLYGDLGGALSPIGDLFKTQVYGLASFINRHGPIIPISTLRREPSAELHEGQLDSDVFPNYQLLDAILDRVFVHGDSVEETAFRTKAPLETVISMANRVLQYEYKRRQAPPVLKVSTSIEMKYPIVDRFQFS